MPDGPKGSKPGRVVSEELKTIRALFDQWAMEDLQRAIQEAEEELNSGACGTEEGAEEDEPTLPKED